MEQFTKSDLKSGMIVTLRSGRKGVVFLNCSDDEYEKNIIATIDKKWISLKGYDENLECQYNDLGIVKVEERLYSLFCDLTAPRKLLWEREEVKEMTIAEIEALVGCKVKIVGEVVY